MSPRRAGDDAGIAIDAAVPDIGLSDGGWSGPDDDPPLDDAPDDAGENDAPTDPGPKGRIPAWAWAGAITVVLALVVGVVVWNARPAPLPDTDFAPGPPVLRDRDGGPIVAGSLFIGYGKGGRSTFDGFARQPTDGTDEANAGALVGVRCMSGQVRLLVGVAGRWSSQTIACTGSSALWFVGPRGLQTGDPISLTLEAPDDVEWQWAVL